MKVLRDSASRSRAYLAYGTQWELGDCWLLNVAGEVKETAPALLGKLRRSF